MSRFLCFLCGFIFFASLDCSAAWHDEQGYKWNYDCDNYDKLTRVVFVLHGAGGNNLTNDEPGLLEPGDIQPIFNRLLSSCALIVTPESGSFSHLGVTHKAWEYTRYYDKGQEMARVISLINTAHNIFNKPVILIGGSAGGIMAYAVASEMQRMGAGDLLSALVLTEAISAYSVTLNNKAPAAYDGISTYMASSGDSSVYLPFKQSDAYAQLGLANARYNWTLPTFIAYSLDDQIIKTHLKEDFANKLADHSTNAQVIISGSGHRIGGDGWLEIEKWLFK